MLNRRDFLKKLYASGQYYLPIKSEVPKDFSFPYYRLKKINAKLYP